jgi:hypothetical protein
MMLRELAFSLCARNSSFDGDPCRIQVSGGTLPRRALSIFGLTFDLKFGSGVKSREEGSRKNRRNLSERALRRGSELDGG